MEQWWHATKVICAGRVAGSSGLAEFEIGITCGFCGALLVRFGWTALILCDSSLGGGGGGGGEIGTG